MGKITMEEAVQVIIEDFIEQYCFEKKEGLYKGFVPSSEMDAYDLAMEIPPIFEEVEEWGNASYRKVWVSDEGKAIITYCEGDIIVKIFKTQEEFEKEMKECQQFYKVY